MPSNHPVDELIISRTVDSSDLSKCASMLSSNEPWITLGIGYDDSLLTLSDPSREVYVAHGDGSILGFVVIEMSGAFTGYIKSICVSSEQRGKGVGGRLMEYVERRILGEKPNVFLCVSDFNEAAQGFYRHLGYEVVGELRNYLVSGSSEILMRKTIAPINEFATQKL